MGFGDSNDPRRPGILVPESARWEPIPLSFRGRYEMRITRRYARAAAGLTVAAGMALLPATGVLAASKTYQYTFTSQHESDSFTDTGLCDPGPADINLTDYNEALHVSATESGLTQDQIEALLENDPSGVIVKASYTQTGSFVVTEASGVTYTGHFTSWFGGNVDGRTVVFSGTFNVNGTGSDGSTISGHFNGHSTEVDGRLVVEFDKGQITGCL